MRALGAPSRALGRFASHAILTDTLRVMHVRCGTIVVLVVLGVVAGGCGQREPVRGTALQLGRALNPDQTVSGHTTRFKPLDTIYASVLTTGSGRATIVARWTYAGQVVSEPRKEIASKGAMATEFHIQNNAGFPPGDYSVEILVNGESVERRAFRVEK